MKKTINSSLIIKAIMLLLAFIVMVFIATSAWFVSEDAPVTASGISVSSQGSAEFDIAIGFETSQTNGYVVSPFLKEYNLTSLPVVIDDKDTVETEDDDRVFYDVFYDFSPLDVTGNGVTLVRPNLTLKNSKIDTNSATMGYSNVDPNQDYISFDMLVRCNEQCNLYLDSGSVAYGKAENTTDGTLHNDTSGVLSDSESTKMSSDFSTDAIVGALRVSFTDYPEYRTDKQTIAEGTTPDALWIPRSDIRYQQIDDNANLYYDIPDYEDSYASYTIQGADDVKMNTYRHHYFEYSVDSSGNTVGEYKEFTEAITIVELNKDDIGICKVDKYNETDGFYYGKVHVNIWLEGCDSESRRALRGGEFIINFDITSEEPVVETTVEETTVN